MSDTAQHAMNGLLILGAHDFSLMTSGANQTFDKDYVGTPTFQLGDKIGISGQKGSQLSCEGYFIKQELGALEAALNRAVADNTKPLTLYAPHGPSGAATIGEHCWLQTTHQIQTTNGGSVGGAVMLNQTYVATGGCRLGKVLVVHTGTDTPGSNETQILDFIAAPTVQQFAVMAEGGTSRYVFTPGDSGFNAALKAGIEAITEYAGLTVTVTGSLTGTSTKTGTLTVAFSGGGDVPPLVVKVSEGQTVTVTGGDNGTYTIAGATFSLGDSASTIQAAIRAIGGIYANVIVAGTTTAPIP